jgi:hypothetical protein
MMGINSAGGRRWSGVAAAAVAVIGLAGCSGGSGTAHVKMLTKAPAIKDTSKPSPQASQLPRGVLASIPLSNDSDAPTGMAAAFGSLWVETHRGGDVYRIDPRTDKIAARISIGQNGCAEPFAADGRVWVGPCSDGLNTIAVDPRSDQVVADVPSSSSLNAVAGGSGWLPSYAAGNLLRVDLSTGKVQAVIDAPGAADVYGRGFIWAANTDPYNGGFDGRIEKVDLATNRVVSTLHVPRIGTDIFMAYSAGALWLKGENTAKLARVSTTTGAATIYRIPNWQPLPDYTDNFIEVAQGSLWIRSSPSWVSRISPRTGKIIKRYPADPAGGGGYPLVAFGSLWISNFTTGTIWRDRL